MATLYGTKGNGRREILLTFDDGPNPKTTPRLLEILAKHSIQAVFFVVGSNLKSELGREVVRNASAAGHLIGNHTFSHPNLKTLSDAKLGPELDRTHDLIREVTGRECALFRPPYGAVDQRVANAVFERGYTQLLWNVDPLDWKYKANGQWVERAKEQIHVRGDALVLMHDIHKTTVDHVERLITWIKKLKNAQFLPYA